MDRKDEASLKSRDKHDQDNAPGSEKHLEAKVENDNIFAPDLKNRGAFKGDDSDGRVNWTPRRVLATLFLSGLYVGTNSM